MARKSVLARQAKRERMVKNHSERRKALKKSICSPDLTMEQRMDAMMALQKMPRDGSASRLRNRCGLTGRSRGYYRRFGLSRNKLREVIMEGQAPGVTKASW